jgi:thiol-disulfide isomerase/thioredoxin
MKNAVFRCIACAVLGWLALVPAAAVSSQPAAGSGGSKETFAVHSRYALVMAPSALRLDEEVKSFQELFAQTRDPKNRMTSWARDEAASEETTANFEPVGFNGNTGYYSIPGAAGPRTLDNTIARGIDFGVTYRNRTGAEVEVQIKVNDNRTTAAAADNIFAIDTKLSKGAFTLIKLGPPQGDKQAWLALLVDNFDAVPMLPTQTSGKLPADKKVDFVFTAADGQQIDTTKMRGKVILVDFWATWCGPCVAAMPRLQELYDKYHQEGLEVIGINLDSDRSLMDSFLKRHPHPWPQSVSAPTGQNPLADRFEIKGIPYFLLIDKAGLASEVEARNPATDDLIEADLKP